MGKLERDFQASLIKRIGNRFPEAVVLKTDPSYIQGVPDLLVLIDDRWFALECKRSFNSHHQPNQDYWVNLFNDMSAAFFVYPENVEEVLDDIELQLGGSL